MRIVKKIIDGKADYTIVLKSNQPILYKDADDYFLEFEKELPCIKTYDKEHGRVEKREYRLLWDISRLEQKKDRKGLQSIGAVKSTIYEDDKKSEYTRYFITSLTDINEFAYSARKH